MQPHGAVAHLFGLTRATRHRARRPASPQSQAAYAKDKEAARSLIKERLAFFNDIYGFTYGRVAIRNQRTIWGSCSGKGNLNFNYRVLFLPPRLADYVIVHELCHLRELNHSPRFWALVSRAVPDYAACRSELRKHLIV